MHSAKQPRWNVGRGVGCIVVLLVAIMVATIGDDSTHSSSPEPSPRASASQSPGAESPPETAASRESELAMLGPTGKRLCRENPTWTANQCDTVARGKIRIGFSGDMVRAAWGTPEKINSTIVESGRREQWVYGMGQYVYVDDGIVTAIQDSK